MSDARELPRTVDAAYGVVDPDVPLEAGDPRYVDLSSARGDENLAANELKCLQGRLDQAGFFTVYLDVTETLDLADVEYLDVLVAVARALDETARARKLRISDNWPLDFTT